MSIPLKEKLPRRDFLIECGHAAAAALLAATPFRSLTAAPPAEPEFHFHPQYREERPLEAILAKRTAALDDFVSEQVHDRIAAVLAEWSEGWRRSPGEITAIQRSLAADFQGSSLQAVEAKLLRPAGAFEVRRLRFPTEKFSDSKAFLNQLQQYFSDFTQLLTADLQVTRLDTASAAPVVTLVRYELVGAGKAFQREQRVGHWELSWQPAGAEAYQLVRWRQMEETRSRCRSAIFADVTAPAFGGNASYETQLLHGSDYWRTVLDSACGVDVYGHNGVAVGDIDGTGLDSLYVCQPSGLPNRLYRNRGDGTFEDVTESAGVGVLENTACAIFADFNNDGLQDLIVVRANGPLLFLNSGGGKFRQKPDAFQFANAPQGTFTGAAAADYSRSGWLDIYFCLYVYHQGTDQYRYPSPYFDANNGPPNFLMRNNRDGTFRDGTAEAGLDQNNTRYSFCCGWTDCDNDGWPDLYVVNDFGRKNLYRNNGNGSFTDVAPQAGVEDIGAGMSVCCFDYNNDGAEDLYVANMWTAAGERISMQDAFRKNSPVAVRALYHKHAMGNSLLKNASNGLFRDETDAAGAGLGRWAWSSDAWDFDHDGFPDLYVTNGMISGPIREDLNSFFWRQVVAKSPDESKPSHGYEQAWNAVNELLRADYSWSGYERNVFYANNRDGTFSDVSGAAGLDFVEDGRAFALADFDQDGRLEVVVKNRQGPQLRLMKNVMDSLPASLCFRLRGSKSNPDAIGAAITLETDIGRQTRRLQAGSGFLSQHTKEIFFGLGEAKGSIKASIRWPSGLTQAFSGLKPNQRIYLTEGSETYRSEPFRRAVLPPTAAPQVAESLPSAVETWLIEPVGAPDFSLPARNSIAVALSTLRGRPALIHLSNSGQPELRMPGSLPVLRVNLDEKAAEETGAIYNILYRWLFDRRRDLTRPTAWLIDEQGDIVKIYQGQLNAGEIYRDSRRMPATAAERVAKALPFPTNADGFAFGRNYLSLGSIYFQRGYFAQAETPFRLALRSDPSSAEARYGLASVFLKQGKQAEARASFEQAAKVTASNPDTKPNVLNHLGLFAMQEGRTGPAIDYFQEALRLNPDHLISLKNLGNAYRQAKRWAEAQTVLERAVSLDAEDADATYSLAMVYAQTNQGQQAYDFLQTTLRLRPVYPEAMNNLAILYLRTRRRDAAVAEFEACIRMAPDFDQSYLNLARVHVIEGDREKARAILQALLKQHPNHPDAERALQELK